MFDIFKEVKTRLDIRDVLEYYGVSINTKNFALCPFHGEKTPSLKLYDGSFYCFGCGESGTVIDFAVKYFGLTNLEAAKKLIADFGLHIADEDAQAPDRTHMAKIEADKKALADFAEWEKRAYSVLARRFRQIHECRKVIRKPDDPDLWEHVANLAEMDFVDWLCAKMIENRLDFDKQVQFYKDYGEVVAAIEQKSS